MERRNKKIVLTFVMRSGHKLKLGVFYDTLEISQSAKFQTRAAFAVSDAGRNGWNMDPFFLCTFQQGY